MHNGSLKILLAEDDFNLGILLVDFLTLNAFTVELCRDGEQALTAFKAGVYDLCLLDVMLPKVDGFTIAQEIKKANKSLPIIFITAKSLKEDKLKGYELGADDYVTKPFDEEELLWKIKAVIRRHPVIEDRNIERVIPIGKYLFDFKNQSLSLNGNIRRITEKECEILRYLSENRDRVIKRSDLLKDVWGEDNYFLGRSLDVFITKMRKYLKDDPSLSIENVFAVGFIFNTKTNSSI